MVSHNRMGVGMAARALALACLCGAASAMMPGMGMGGGKDEKKFPAVKADVKYIRCGVCEEMAKNMHREIKKMRDELPKTKKKLPEIDIIEKIEKFCDPEATAGEWITHLDMLEDGNKIKMVHHEMPAKCETECRTIARACEETLGDADTDIAEALYKGEMKRAALRDLLCSDLSDACDGAAPKVPKSRKKGPDFVEMDAEAVKMRDMMASMKDIPGMPGMNMYSRDDLQGMMDGYGGGGYGDDYGGGGYGGDYGGDEDMETMPTEEAEAGSTTGFDVTNKVFEAVDTATEAVTEGITKAAGAAADIGGKVKDWATGLFKGDEAKKEL